MTLAEAQQALDGVRERAEKLGIPVCAAVVDEGGNPLATMRMDGAQLGAYQLAIDKAWTAVAFHAPTEEWAEATVPGQGGWGFSTALGGRVIVFAGGLPVVVDERTAGGIGVSGSSADVDSDCARAGLSAIN